MFLMSPLLAFRRWCNRFQECGSPMASHVLMRKIAAVGLGVLAMFVSVAHAAEIQIDQKAPDPYGSPRPYLNAVNVPTQTSYYITLSFTDTKDNDAILPESIAVQIAPENGNAIAMLSPGKIFAPGYSGAIVGHISEKGLLVINIDSNVELKSATKYTVSVSAESKAGGRLRGKAGQWSFTTEDKAAIHPIQCELDLAASPTRWHGGFHTGFCKTTFCTSAKQRIGAYELMDAVRKQYPKAFSVVRDLWPTGMEHQPMANAMINWALPNVVRERETRRIVSMKQRNDGILLNVEDFFGHEQYGIASNRPLADDYHPGDEVLIADGVNHARTTIVKVTNDAGSARALVVAKFEEPKGGWKIAYTGALPTKESPEIPGLFPPGGCYLRKFAPAGTPHYYWGRWDKEYDVQHRRFGRRLLVNFCDAPGDLSVDGQNWTYPKDYAEYHEVVKVHVAHLIERYGRPCKDFTWSVFNEADLASSFWRSKDWNHLQRFYDYTVDAVCRAFEDKGYDSSTVFVGGLELGAIWGIRIEGQVLRPFLTHCSPKAKGPGALPQNAAFIDKRLNGKRSQRTEKLCRANNGKGTPCDFISVHTYNSAPVAAQKLILAKKVALEIDPEYYAGLWINSGESCPDWAPPPDSGASESYFANGYWTSWTADMARRQLAKAAEDPRYGFGETYISVWPWPNHGLDGMLDNETRLIAVDDNGDGLRDRDVIIAEPILHFVGLMAGMGDDYLVLGEQKFGGQAISGFAARRTDAVNVLIYAHDPMDPQSRSAHAFDVVLDIKNVPWKNVRVRQYKFDKDNNSYYRLGLSLRASPAKVVKTPSNADQVKRLLAAIDSGDPKRQIDAVKEIGEMGDIPQALLAAVMALHENTRSEEVRSKITEVGENSMSRWQKCYPASEVARVKDMSQLHVTGQSDHKLDSDGVLRLPIHLAGNGADFVVIEPATSPSTK